MAGKATDKGRVDSRMEVLTFDEDGSLLPQLESVIFTPGDGYRVSAGNGGWSEPVSMLLRKAELEPEDDTSPYPPKVYVYADSHGNEGLLVNGVQRPVCSRIHERVRYIYGHLVYFGFDSTQLWGVYVDNGLVGSFIEVDPEQVWILPGGEGNYEIMLWGRAVDGEAGYWYNGLPVFKCDSSRYSVFGFEWSAATRQYAFMVRDDDTKFTKVVTGRMSVQQIAEGKTWQSPWYDEIDTAPIGSLLDEHGLLHFIGLDPEKHGHLHYSKSNGVIANPINIDAIKWVPSSSLGLNSEVPVVIGRANNGQQYVVMPGGWISPNHGKIEHIWGQDGRVLTTASDTVGGHKLFTHYADTSQVALAVPDEHFTIGETLVLSGATNIVAHTLPRKRST